MCNAALQQQQLGGLRMLFVTIRVRLMSWDALFT